MDTSALIEQAYLSLCDKLFSLWAKNVRTNKELARKARSWLKALHRAYAKDQACPQWYADKIEQRIQFIR